MAKDISRLGLVKFRRDDAHRTGRPKHHTGTSSKRPQGAAEGENMKARFPIPLKSADVLELQHWKEGSTRWVCMIEETTILTTRYS